MRWTPETEELVTSTIRAHIDVIDRTGPNIRCDCGKSWPLQLRKINMPFDHLRTEVAAEYRRHRAAAVLTALADAGLLLPPGGEMREEWQPDNGGFNRPYFSKATAMHAAAQSAMNSGIVRRVVTAWPDGSMFYGPWRAVPELQSPTEELVARGCEECGGRGSYFTEWSDAAEKEKGIIVLYRPDPPDGTVEIQCPMCKGNARTDIKEEKP